MLAACSADRGDDGINDPYEPMNRKVHAFNRGLDARVVKPLGSGMSGGNGVGSHAVGAVGNFGSNLAQPGKVVNHLLQGKPGPAARSTLRFLVNTTLGLAGFLDRPAAISPCPRRIRISARRLPPGGWVRAPIWNCR